MAEKARKHPDITVLTSTEVENVSGDSVLRLLRYRNTKTGEVHEYRPPQGETFGVFVFAGYEPATALVNGIAELDEQGYVITDRTQKTNVDGLYAAGDVCIKNLRQVVTAVGDGALAATELERYAADMQEKTGLYPVFRSPVQTQVEQQTTDGESELFGSEMIAQLGVLFEKMRQPLILQLTLDDRPVSEELRNYMEKLAGLTDKLRVEFAPSGHQEEFLPSVRVLRNDGAETGLAFHGVPGGHEFTSFVLGLYNASGPGQTIDESQAARIRQIDREIRLKIMVSLSCIMCPELVTAAQRIAAESPLVTAEVYDLNHFPQLKEQYRVMSVPCMVMNDDQITFGKKDLGQVLDFIG